jgi:hypothetical protein
LGLERLDHIRGLPYGGAAITKVTQKIYKKPSSSVGMVASAQDNLDTIKQLEFQPESWTGAINLDEDHVKLL